MGFINSNIEIPEAVLKKDPNSHISNKSCPQSMLKCLLTKTKLTRDERASFYKLKVAMQPRYDHEKPKHQKRLNYLTQLIFGDGAEEVRNKDYHSDGWEEIGFQGKDPRTDFRGGGYSGLDMLINFMVENDEHFKRQKALTS